MRKMAISGLTLFIFSSACAGVPQLYKPKYSTAGDQTLAPKVNDIIDEISCELASANDAMLTTREHIVTVLLTIQVDDNLNVTPTFLVTSMLSGVGRTFGLSEGLDVGGARRRTFTTTFHLDSAKLAAYAPDCAERHKKRLYRLDGDLGLSEIVRDGTAAIRKLTPIQYVTTGKMPSYGSTVQFVVNRSLSALGPLWTLNSFKGPSGSSGLVNGKQLNTDILTITFSPVIDTSAKVADRQKVAVAKSLEVATTARRSSDADRTLTEAVEASRTAKRNAARYGYNKNASQSAEDAKKAEDEARAAKDASAGDEARAREELRAAVEQVRAAEVEHAQDARRAAEASESLLQTMVLQGIGAVPR